MAKKGLPSVRSTSGRGQRAEVVVELVARLGRQQVLDALAVEPAERRGVRRPDCGTCRRAAHRARASGRPRCPDRCRARTAGGRVRRRAGGAAGRPSTAPPSAGRRAPARPLGPRRRGASRSVTASKSRACSSVGLGPDRVGRVDGRDQAPDLAAVRGHVGRHHLGVERRHPCSQGLGEGLVRHRQVLLAATEEHQRALVVGPAGERRHQAGLAHARFTGDEHRATLARARRLERGAQPVELGASADHPFRRGRRQRNRQRHSCARRART